MSLKLSLNERASSRTLRSSSPKVLFVLARNKNPVPTKELFIIPLIRTCPVVSPVG